MSKQTKQQLFDKGINALVSHISKKQRPIIDPPSYVEPSLFQCAHAIFTTSNDSDNDTGTGGKNITSVKHNTLYLGPQRAASRHAYDALCDANVVAIVNCTNSAPCVFQSQHHNATIHDDGRRRRFKYCQVPINDIEQADILTFLEGSTTFIHNILQNEGSILVHCQVGMSRSASVVIAYLMRYQGMTRDEAYCYCKKRRPIVNPNQGFWTQLYEYERMIKLKQRTQMQNPNQPFITTITTSTTTATTAPDHTLSQETHTFNTHWAIQSNALYTTCREIPNILYETESYQHLNNLNSYDEVSELMFTCLDFVWGRGILMIDIEWFVHICDNIVSGSNRITKSTGLMVGLPWLQREVERMLTNPESKFSQIWAGEIYPNDVNKVLEALSNTN